MIKFFHTTTIIALWLLVLAGGFFLVSEVAIAGNWQSWVSEHMPTMEVTNYGCE